MAEPTEVTDPTPDRQALICQALGLDPTEIDGVTLQFSAGAPLAIWSGSRKLTVEKFAGIVNQLGPVPEPQTPEIPE